MTFQCAGHVCRRQKTNSSCVDKGGGTSSGLEDYGQGGLPSTRSAIAKLREVIVFALQMTWFWPA